MKKQILLFFLGCMFCSLAYSQQIIKYQLSGQGQFSNFQASFSGNMNYTSYGAWDQTGDYKKFKGQIIIKGYSYTFTYEGYTNLAPYQGKLYLSDRTVAIEVLDNSNGMMYIHDGSGRTYSPEEYGRFTSNWKRL